MSWSYCWREERGIIGTQNPSTTTTTTITQWRWQLHWRRRVKHQSTGEKDSIWHEEGKWDGHHYHHFPDKFMREQAKWNLCQTDFDETGKGIWKIYTHKKNDVAVRCSHSWNKWIPDEKIMRTAERKVTKLPGDYDYIFVLSHSTRNETGSVMNKLLPSD